MDMSKTPRVGWAIRERIELRRDAIAHLSAQIDEHEDEIAQLERLLPGAGD